MRHLFYLFAALTLLSLLYNSAPPLSFIPIAFLIGLAYIPIFTILVYVDPDEAAPIKSNSTSARYWCPKGLDTAYILTLITFTFFASRDMDLIADVSARLAGDFEIFLHAHKELSVLWTVGMSAASVAALAYGQRMSWFCVPPLQRCGLLKWDTRAMEDATLAEGRSREWSLRAEREGFH